MDVEYDSDSNPVQMLAVPEGKMDEALQAINSLSDERGGGRSTVEPADATGTSCIHTTSHDWVCTDDT
jgi:hypothetical protein